MVVRAILIMSTDNGNSWSLFDSGLPQLAIPGFQDSIVQPTDLFSVNNLPYVITQPVVGQFAILCICS